MYLQLPAETQEYIRVPVRVLDLGVEIDPITTGISVAIVDRGVRPESSDWKDGSWELNRTVLFARVMFGTGDLALSVGEYDVWIKITTGLETIVRLAGPMDVI